MNHSEPELQVEVVKKQKSNHEKMMELFERMMVTIDELKVRKTADS